MAEEVTRISYGLGVSGGEALYYLEGFDWKLDEATQACRDKNLPPVKVKSAPKVPVNEKSAAVESPATPLGVIPLQILSYEASIQREQQPRQSKDDLVDKFCEVVQGASIRYAIHCLEASNWNVQHAIGSHMEKYDPTLGQLESQRHLGIDRSTNEGLNLGVSSMDAGTSSSPTYPPGFSGGYHTVIGNWNSQQLRPEIDPSTLSDRTIPPGHHSIVRSKLQRASTDDSTSTAPWYPPGLSEDESSMAFTPDSMYGMGPSFSLPSQSQFQASLNSLAGSYSSMETSFKEDGLVEIPVTASSEMEETENIPDPTGRICDERQVSRDEARYYLEGSNWDLITATEACRTETLPPVKKAPARVEQRTTIIPPRVISSHSVPNQQPNSLQQQLPQLSDEDISSFCNVTGRNHNIAIYCLNRCNGNVENAIGYCIDQRFPEDFLQDVTSNPTEEAGDQNVTIAFPSPMTSSEVDKSKAVADEEDSSAEMVEPQAVPGTMTTIEIRLADETTLKIPLRSDQTVRDIRKAMEESRPDITRENYSLMSMDNVDFLDLNIAVEKFASDGYATLIQVFLD